MLAPPPRNWVYFLNSAAEELRHSAQISARRTHYVVESSVVVRGESVASMVAGAELTRLFCDSPIAGLNDVLLAGSSQHLQYANAAQRDHLAAVSAKEFSAGATTRAVIIPIRKNAAWWRLAHDERLAFFNPSPGKEGHTTIGERYAGRIFRQLLHARYDAAKPPYDFVTYFEFNEADTSAFTALLGELRDETLNPEWRYVEMEQEFWLRKVG